jgi:pilus assembly protein Flp/PilA
MNLLQSHLRTSDYIYQVRNETGVNFGVLLPETDDRGAKVVGERLSQLCCSHDADMKLALAVYPDDGTTSEKLMQVAFGTDCRIYSDMAEFNEPYEQREYQFFSKDGLSGNCITGTRAEDRRPKMEKGEFGMEKFVEKMKALVRDEEGATAVEYGVMVAAIIGVVITVVVAIGDKLWTAFDHVDTELDSIGSGS